MSSPRSQARCLPRMICTNSPGGKRTGVEPARSTRMNEETLFQLALEKPPHERAAFLEQACAGDPALRQRLAILLLVHDNPGSFMAQPALNLVATVDH